MIILGTTLDKDSKVTDCVCKLSIKEMCSILGVDGYDIQKILKEGKTDFENVSNDINRSKTIISSRQRMVSALTGLIDEAKKHIINLTVEGEN